MHFQKRFRDASLATVIGMAGLAASVPALAQDAPTAAKARFVIEGMSLWRNSYEGGRFTDSDPGSVGIISDVGDLDPDTTAGIRFLGEIPASALGGMLPPGYALQFVAMYAKGFEDRIRFDDPNENTSTTYVADLGGIVDPSLDDANSDQLGRFFLDINTTLWGYESNTLTPAGSVLGGRAFFGTRFIHFSEALRATSFDDFPPSDNNHHVSIDVDNNLYGLQAGWEGYFKVGSVVAVGGRVAGGLFLNRATRERSFTDQDTPGNAYSDDLTENEFSQMLEANPRILISLSDNVALTLGGTVLWVNDVSSAATHWSNMLNLNDRDIRADDDVLFYGFTAGLTINLN